MIIPLAKRQNADTLHAIADPIAASGPSDGQAPSFELSKRNVGRRGQNPNMAAVPAMQTVALLSPGDIMSGHTLVGLIGFGACIVVAVMFGAWVF